MYVPYTHTVHIHTTLVYFVHVLYVQYSTVYFIILYLCAVYCKYFCIQYIVDYYISSTQYIKKNFIALQINTIIFEKKKLDLQ